MDYDDEREVYQDPGLPKFEHFHKEKRYGRGTYLAPGKKPIYKNKRFGKKDKYDFDEE